MKLLKKEFIYEKSQIGDSYYIDFICEPKKRIDIEIFFM